MDMLNPIIIYQNAKSLYFSAFGVPMDEFQVKYDIKVPLSGENMINRNNDNHHNQQQQQRSSKSIGSSSSSSTFSVQTKNNFDNFIENIINFFVPGINNNNNNNKQKFRLMNKDEIIKSIDQSKWVSIPSVYIQNKNMINSLVPLILIAIGTSLFTYSSSIVIDDYQNNENNNNNIVVVSDFMSKISNNNNYKNLGIYNFMINNNNKNEDINMNIIDSTISSTTTTATTPTTPTISPSSLSPSTTISTTKSSSSSSFIANTEEELSSELFEQVTSTVIDAFSLVLLVQLAKIIGKDRDAVIASKIQLIAKEFPVSRK